MNPLIGTGLLAALLTCLCPLPALSQAAGQPANGCDLTPGRATSLKDLPFLYNGGKAPAAFTVLAGDLEVNSDGSPRAYSLTDPLGSRLALNDLRDGEVFAIDKQGLIGNGERDRYAAAIGQFASDSNNLGAGPPNYSVAGDKDYKIGGDFFAGLDEPNPPKPAPEAAIIFHPKSELLTTAVDLSAQGPITKCSQLPKGSLKFTQFDCKDAACAICIKTAIIPVFSDKTGKHPCLRQTGKYAGFLASSTALDDYAANAPDPDNDDGIALPTECNYPIRTDAEKLPGFVLPLNALPTHIGKQKIDQPIVLAPIPLAGGPAAGGPTKPTKLYPDIGDVVVAQNRRTGNWVYGVVSDAGPNDQIGEGSIAFDRILRYGYSQTAPRPVMYCAKREAGKCVGDPAVVDVIHLSISKHLAGEPDTLPNSPIAVLILPGTAKLLKMPGATDKTRNLDLSPANVTAKAFHAFLAWGNGGIAKADGQWTDADKQRAWDKFRDCRAKLVDAASGNN